MKVRVGGRTRHFKAVWFERGRVRLIDQRRLPFTFRVLECRTVEAVARAIEGMAVRGAPAIGVAAAYGLALAGDSPQALRRAAARLRRTRPTGRDLFHALDTVLAAANPSGGVLEAAKAYAADIEDRCRRIGVHGERLIRRGSRILTHCNAGALATVDYGTVNAPLQLAHAKRRRFFVWVSETRPRLQGARLTAWELAQEGIDHAVIADAACGHLFQRGLIDLVLVGADRIAANGDFANKIGTYEKAVLAREHGVPFYVAAPLSTFDLKTRDGRGIRIEERPGEEITEVAGRRVANPGSRAYNPAFDVTPGRYVTAFITEKGLIRPKGVPSLRASGARE